LPAVASILIAVASIGIAEHGMVGVSDGSSGAVRLLLGDFDVPPGASLADELRALGAKPIHLFPPDAAIAWIPDDALDAIAVQWPQVEVFNEGAFPEFAAVLTDAQRHAVLYWHERWRLEEADEADVSAGDGGESAPKDAGLAGAGVEMPGAFEPSLPDVFIRPEPAPAKDDGALAAASAPYGASFWDLSEYMLGDVALSIVLVESNGAIDANTETWTQTQRNEIAAEVPNAMNWWIARAGARPLTISYTFRDAATGYEPITRTQPQEGLWVADAMASIGYASGDYFTRTATFNNAIRDSAGTDWAITVFIVNSKIDADGKFADSYFAYAYLGGPFIIMTYDNNGWGIANMDAVLAHEMAHSFYALDEYATANQPCSKTSGYLAASNGNSALAGCPMNEANSIMRSVLLSVAVLDSFTMGQIGWWDGDVDGLSNPIDTESRTNILSYGPTAGNPYRLTFAGTADDVPLTNMNPFGYNHDITLNEIAGVEWRIDGGTWTAATVVDGAWDESLEDFSFVTEQLGLGTHIVQTRATNVVGNVQSVADAETVVVLAATAVEPGGPEIGLPASAPIVTLNDARPNPTHGPTEISWSLSAPARVTLDIYDISGRRVRELASGEFEAGAYRASWDGLDESGAPAASGHYLYRLEAGGHHETKRLVLVH
jgi:hypothetical protein